MRPDDQRSTDESIRTPTVDDAASLWRLARSAGLDLNAPYAYLLFCHDFAETSLVAEGSSGGVVAFVTGYRPPGRRDTIFVWQVAVRPAARGRGLGTALVDRLVTELVPAGVKHLEASVTPTNEASRRLFEAVAARRGAELTKSTLFASDLFPGGEHDEELLLRIGPFEAPARDPT
jgi:L-2,4-diaminobutyric acid acetyltransferase